MVLNHVPNYVLESFFFLNFVDNAWMCLFSFLLISSSMKDKLKEHIILIIDGLCRISCKILTFLSFFQRSMFYWHPQRHRKYFVSDVPDNFNQRRNAMTKLMVQNCFLSCFSTNDFLSEIVSAGFMRIFSVLISATCCATHSIATINHDCIVRSFIFWLFDRNIVMFYVNWSIIWAKLPIK